MTLIYVMIISAILLTAIGAFQKSSQQRKVEGVTFEIEARKTVENKLMRRLYVKEQTTQSGKRNLKGAEIEEIVGYEKHRKALEKRVAADLKTHRELASKNKMENRKLQNYIPDHSFLEEAQKTETDMIFGIETVFGRVPTRAPTPMPSIALSGGSYAPTPVMPTYAPTVDTTFLAHENKSTNLPASVSLDDLSNNEYIGAVGVGTPPQVLTVVFDTGSADFWIPSQACTTCGDKNTFDSAASSTYKPVYDRTIIGSSTTIQSFEISYGSGRVSGEVCTETLSFNTLQVPNFLIAQATYEDPMIASFLMDGVLGLGFPSLSVLNSDVPIITEQIATLYPNLRNAFSM